VTQQKELEKKLDSFDREERRNAFLELSRFVQEGKIRVPEVPFRVNLHFHTFFSYNALGYSPLHIIWRAKNEGLGMAASVDFDVLDAVEEFQWGGLEVSLPVSSGLETRIHLPEFQDEELNSPGEPGVAYYMGYGFTRLPEQESRAAQTAAFLKETAHKRNRAVIERVNAYLAPVMVDEVEDVFPLTPSQNPTERHIVLAYLSKAEYMYPSEEERVAFWAEKLDLPATTVKSLITNNSQLADVVRMKLIKKGGAGYVKPDAGEFPTLNQVNAMIQELGALPSFGWLDGTRSGERDPKRLLHFCMERNVETLFIVPERNWNIPDPDERRTKTQKLHTLIELAHSLDMPVFAGTELNKHGQKFVDEFDSPALAPLAPSLFESAWILWGHTALERTSRRGWGSEWARRTFPERRHRNRFFASLGRSVPATHQALKKLGETSEKDLLSHYGQ